MTQIHVAAGSNIEPERHIPGALRRIASRYGPVDHSPFYITEAIDRPWQAPYWNGVIRFDVDGARLQTHQTLRRIEADEGRERNDDAYAARTLDLDILLWDGKIADRDAEEELLERPWLSIALASLEPEFKVGGRPVLEIAEEQQALNLAPFP